MTLAAGMEGGGVTVPQTGVKTLPSLETSIGEIVLLNPVKAPVTIFLSGQSDARRAPSLPNADLFPLCVGAPRRVLAVVVVCGRRPVEPAFYIVMLGPNAPVGEPRQRGAVFDRRLAISSLDRADAGLGAP